MDEEFPTTREVSRYLKINEKQVYRRILERGIPCTRGTGKWLFPKGLVEEWVLMSTPERRRGSDETRQENRILGTVVRLIPRAPLLRVEVDCGFPLIGFVAGDQAEQPLSAGRRVTARFPASPVRCFFLPGRTIRPRLLAAGSGLRAALKKR